MGVSTICSTSPKEIRDLKRFGRLVHVDDSEAMSDAISNTSDPETDRWSVNSVLEFKFDKILVQFDRLIGDAIGTRQIN